MPFNSIQNISIIPSSKQRYKKLFTSSQIDDINLFSCEKSSNKKYNSFNSMI